MPPTSPIASEAVAPVMMVVKDSCSNPHPGTHVRRSGGHASRHVTYVCTYIGMNLCTCVLAVAPTLHPGSQALANFAAIVRMSTYIGMYVRAYFCIFCTFYLTTLRPAQEPHSPVASADQDVEAGILRMISFAGTYVYVLLYLQSEYPAARPGAGRRSKSGQPGGHFVSSFAGTYVY